MMTPATDTLLFILLWATTAFSGVAAALALARLGARRARRHAHRDVERLMAGLTAVARGGRARGIRRMADASSESVFWTALESLAPGLDRPAWRRLSGAIERTHYVRAEIQALRDDSPWRRELAARRVATIHSGVPRRSLRSALRRGPAPVALLAAHGLARQRDGWTLHWVLDHPDAFATRPSRALSALLRAFGPGATPVLAARLRDGIAHFALERAVIERLGAAGHAPAAPLIAGRLEHVDLEVRVAAARALGRIREASCTQALVSALEDSAWEVRAQAARALGRAGAAEAIDVLAQRLSDPAWWVRRHAAHALRDVGPEGLAALEEVAASSSDPFAREIAGEALLLRTAEPRIA